MARSISERELNSTNFYASVSLGWQVEAENETLAGLWKQMGLNDLIHGKIGYLQIEADDLL